MTTPKIKLTAYESNVLCTLDRESQMHDRHVHPTGATKKALARLAVLGYATIIERDGLPTLARITDKGSEWINE